MGASASSAGSHDGDSGAKPATALAGTWEATRKDLWKFDAMSYGGRVHEFSQEGFHDFRLDLSGEDGTFTFRYGRLCVGKGQWFESAAGTYVGYAEAKTTVGNRTHIRQSRQVLQLMEDDVLKVTYTVADPSKPLIADPEGFEIVRDGACDVTVTEYIRRSDADVAVSDDADPSTPWMLINEVHAC